MAGERFDWSAEEMVAAADGDYVLAADLATALTNLTYAKTMLSNYLSTSPQSLNGASVKLVAYIDAAITALTPA